MDFAWRFVVDLVTRLKRGIQYGVVETRNYQREAKTSDADPSSSRAAKREKAVPARLRRYGYHDRNTLEPTTCF